MRKAIARGLRCLSASVVAGSLCLPALADNQMGYRLLSQQDAQDLPRNHGGLGMDIEAAQLITDGGMTFDLIRVKQVRSGSPGEQAGFHAGDEIIAVNGDVFSSLSGFRGVCRFSPAGKPDQCRLHPGWWWPATGSTNCCHRWNGGAGGSTSAAGRAIWPAAHGPIDRVEGRNRRWGRGSFWMLRARLFLPTPSPRHNTTWAATSAGPSTKRHAAKLTWRASAAVVAKDKEFVLLSLRPFQQSICIFRVQTGANIPHALIAY